MAPSTLIRSPVRQLCLAYLFLVNFGPIESQTICECGDQTQACTSNKPSSIDDPIYCQPCDDQNQVEITGLYTEDGETLYRTTECIAADNPDFVNCNCDNGSGLRICNNGFTANVCQSCDSGYSLDYGVEGGISYPLILNGNLYLREVTCLENKSCPSQHSANSNSVDLYTGCTSCESGFHFQNDDPTTKTCIRNQCVCDNGVLQQEFQTMRVGNDEVEVPTCVVDQSYLCGECAPKHHKNEVITEKPNVFIHGQMKDFANVTEFFCEANECYCDFGQPISNDNCDEHNSHVCDPSSCNEFYHYNAELGYCVPNICICEYGQAVTENCRVHDDIDNQQCDPDGCFGYYHYNQKSETCKENICSCENGEFAIGEPESHDFEGGNPGCIEHNSAGCRLCHQFYYENVVDSQMDSEILECLPNVCTCNNGTIANSCPENDMEFCAECDNYFHLVISEEDERFCQPNICSCENGKVNDFCLHHDVEDCDSENCDDFFRPVIYQYRNQNIEEIFGEMYDIDYGSGEDYFEYLEDQLEVFPKYKCVENKCVCPNGKVNEESCNENKMTSCVSCDYGYYLNEINACVKNLCVCENGYPPELCPVDGMQACSDCFEYHYSNDNFTG